MRLFSKASNWFWFLVFLGLCLIVYLVAAHLSGVEGFSLKLFLISFGLLFTTGPLAIWIVDSTDLLPANLGELAVAETDLSPEGTIRFKDGEVRKAISFGPTIFKGEEVTVTEVKENGKILVVGRANPPEVQT